MGKKMIFILIALLSFILLTMIGLWINHNIKLNKSSKEYEPPGELISIHEKKMHVYVEGDGPHTFVFLSGHGTSSPLLDFKPLWSKLAIENKVVIVEKLGYGFSDVSNQKKDLDTLLEETRSALSILGVDGPYVLVFHSLSGLQAIFWAQKYPYEIEALIGLDPTTPDTIPLLPIPSQVQLNLVYAISRLGISRLMPKSELQTILPLLNTTYLTEEEKDIYQYMFYRSSLTKDMLNELKASNQNAQLIKSLDFPISIPVYFFISEEQDLLIPGWKQTLIDFIEPFDVKNHMVLDTSHYVHHTTSQVIYDEILIFLN
jgi:pimeloyl-ACP methyl ester carboxylesterase